MEYSGLKDKRSWAIALGILVCGLLIFELFLRSFIYLKNENVIRDPDVNYINKAGTHYFQAIEGYGNTYYAANDKIASSFNTGTSVVIFGDSYTEGYQVNENEKYVSVAGRLLNERGIDVDMNNLGKSETFLADHVWLLQTANQLYKPKIVVIQLNASTLSPEKNSNQVNSFERKSDGSLQLKHQQLALESSNNLLLFLQRSSSFFGYGYYRFKLYKTIIMEEHSPSSDPTKTSAKTNYLEDEATIIDELSILKNEYAGVKFVIILTPPFPIIGKDNFISDNLQYDELVTRLKKIPDIVVIDPSAEFVNLVKNNRCPSGFDNSTPCSGHWNKYAHEIVGRLLADELQKIIK